MTNNKKLTPSEILKALADGKLLCDDTTIFKLEDGYVQSRCLMDLNSKFVNCGCLINQLFLADLYIYPPPEPKKNLLERFSKRFGINITYEPGHILTDISKSICSDELIAWLDWQPESRAVTKKKLSEKFKEKFSDTRSYSGWLLSDADLFYKWIKENEDE